MEPPVDELVARLRDSVGPAVFEDGLQLPNPPEQCESWVELQGDVVVAAKGATREERTELAVALLDAILHQPSFGPSNRLDETAFALILESIPERLERALARRSVETMYGGRRYLHRHLWQLTGSAGADWLRRLAEADDIAANFLFQDMAAEKIPAWHDADWPDRLDGLATLPREPRPGIVVMLSLSLGRLPSSACPALTRVVLAHAVDERDALLRSSARRVRDLRTTDPKTDVELFDWETGRRRPELFRWFLELSGEPGARVSLVEHAVETARVSQEDGHSLMASLDRPAWADGPVPWTVTSVMEAAVVRLPDGAVTGGDPWWTGGAEGLPWVVDLTPGAYPVDVVVASHPLAGEECAALHLRLATGTVATWSLVSTALGLEGYTVEVGVAGLGSVGAYDPPRIFDEQSWEEEIGSPGPWWRQLDAGDAGSLLMCSVGPQHQMCRTWLGMDAHGKLVALVTDLGLLALDLETESRLPWRDPASSEPAPRH